MSESWIAWIAAQKALEAEAEAATLLAEAISETEDEPLRRFKSEPKPYVKRWHVVRDSSCGEAIDDPDAEVWTLSRNPDQTGWDTDSGCHGYGLKKADAEELARCANFVDWSKGTIIPPGDDKT